MHSVKQLTNQQCSGLFGGLALLLHAGIPLADGVYLLVEQEQDELKQLLTELGQRLDEGATLSAAVEESGLFSEYVVGMIRVGEQTGRLEECFCELDAYYRQQQRTAERLRSALAYPSVILLLMLVVLGVLLVYVLPVFDRVYASLGSRLTGVAAWLLQLGLLLKKALPMLLVLLAVAAAAAAVLAFSAGLRQKVVLAVKQHFGDKGVLQMFNNARFSRAVAMALASGLTAEEAVALAQKLLADIPAAAQRCAACAVLLQTQPLYQAMTQTGLLPAVHGRMLAIGQRSGNSDRVMEEIADRMVEEAAARLEGLISKVEPAMVLAASLLVGAILLAVMLPLMNIMSAIG